MTPRILIVADAPSAARGGLAWLRTRMMAECYRSAGMAPEVLLSSETPPGDGAARRLLSEVPLVAIAPPEACGAAATRLLTTRPYAAAHFARAGLSQAVPARAGAARIIDMQTPADPALLSDATVVIAADAAGAVAAGREAVIAPVPLTGRRRARIARRGQALLAGCWVEAEDAAITAASAFFAEIAKRGGGAPPNFALAGPGAPAVVTPPLPRPVTRMPGDLSEAAFLRGVDIAIAPGLAGGAPRLDIVSALELGAAPLASCAALTGLRDHWRLPCFDDLDGLAHFLFERGGEMGEGGMLAELNARADWTWSRLTAAAANQRRALITAVRAAVGNEKGETHE